jgi:hypothetical protein
LALIFISCVAPLRAAAAPPIDERLGNRDNCHLIALASHSWFDFRMVLMLGAPPIADHRGFLLLGTCSVRFRAPGLPSVDFLRYQSEVPN